MTNSKTRRAKGEQTRRSILEAALRLIVERGHNAVTHRSVAAEADVNLSLTTYYFKDLKELIAEAFELFRAGYGAVAEETWGQLYENFQGFEAKTPEARAALCDGLVDWGVNFIVEEVQNRPGNLFLEMVFFYDLHVDPRLRQAAVALQNRFTAEFTKLCEQLGSSQPETDAALLLGTLQRLEYQALAVPENIDREAIRAQLRRLLGFIMGV